MNDITNFIPIITALEKEGKLLPIEAGSLRNNLRDGLMNSDILRKHQPISHDESMKTRAWFQKQLTEIG